MGLFSSPKTVADLIDQYPTLCTQLVIETSSRVLEQERQRVGLARPKTAEALKMDFPELTAEIEANAHAKGQAEAHQRVRHIFTGLVGMRLADTDDEALNLLLDGSKSVEATILEFGQRDKRNKALRLDLMRAEANKPAKLVPHSSTEPDAKKAQEEAADDGLMRAMEALNRSKELKQHGARPHQEASHA